MSPAESLVSLSVPAAPEFLHLLRTVAGGVAARLDRTVEQIDDLRLAVDEAAGRVLSAGGATEIELRIDRSADDLTVRIRSDAETDGAWPGAVGVDAMSRSILEALTEDVRFGSSDGGPSVSFRVGIGQT